MGGDKVLSEIYFSTLIIIAFQLLFPGNSGAGCLAIPPEAMVSAASIVESVTFQNGLSWDMYVNSSPPVILIISLHLTWHQEPQLIVHCPNDSSFQPLCPPGYASFLFAFMV